MSKREKNIQSNLVHKFNIMFVITEGKGDYRIEARKIVNAIWSEYQTRKDGALWVHRMIENYKKGDCSFIDSIV